MTSPEPTYEHEAFRQRLKRVAKPVFGLGWTVTKQDVMNAFLDADPTNDPTPVDDVVFNALAWAAMQAEVEAMGFKIRSEP